MGLFDKKTEVDVRVDDDEVVAGGVVVAHADFGEPDKKAQGARIELGYRNRYQEDDQNSDGDTITSTTSSDVIRASQQISLDGALGTAPVRAELTVPADAPGSAADTVDWFVRAVVDRKLARDANASLPLTVRVPADPLASWADSPPETDGACRFELDPSTRVVRPGDRITGTLRVVAEKPISARCVRVQLHRKRFDPDHNRTVDDKTRVELCGETDLRPGEELVLPFDIGVPPGAAPSFRAKHNHLHWYLEGVVDVPRHSDPTISLEVLVHNA